MTFWNSNRVEPKRDFRWIGLIELNSPDETSSTNIDLFTISSWSAPELNVEKKEWIHPLSGIRTILPSEAKWSDIEISIVDVEPLLAPIKNIPIVGEAAHQISNQNNSAKIYKWLVSNGYDPDGDIRKFVTQASQPALSNLTLLKLDSNGAIYEEFLFLGPKLNKVTFGNKMDYNSDNISMVTLGFSVESVAYNLMADKPGARPTGITEAIKKKIKKLFGS